MYTIICQAQGPRRKELVNAISEFTGMKSNYLKVPSCAYQIGELKVNKEGNIICEGLNKKGSIVMSSWIRDILLMTI